jgi:hypothetical protein
LIINILEQLTTIKCCLNSNILNLKEYEHYQKGSFRNRTIIPGANGLIPLSVPLQNGRDQRALFKNIKIAYKRKLGTPTYPGHWMLVTCVPHFMNFTETPFLPF